jgi:hypothetical protein
MPNFDGSGPQGLGAGTGRGMGPCGLGMKRGFGRGFCRFFGLKQRITPTQEKQILEEEAKILEDELKATKERLGELRDQK